MLSYQDGAWCVQVYFSSAAYTASCHVLCDFFGVQVLNTAYVGARHLGQMSANI
jgi:hypothetical protein